MGLSSLYGQDSKGVLVDYRLLATNKTSTMVKELNEAAVAGYRFEQAMGGDTALRRVRSRGDHVQEQE